jgi:hypothetical protein
VIIRIFASSENWKVNGPRLTQREDPPTPLPIASVTTSRPRFTNQIGHASVLSQR